MTRCPRQVPKKRVSTTNKGNPGDYEHPMKGHTWVGHGRERHCEHCGCVPR